MAVTRAQRRMSSVSTGQLAIEDPPDKDDLDAWEDAQRGAAPRGDDSVVLEPGDASALALLTLLYTLQGVPMGLASSITFLLQEKGASYAAQGARFGTQRGLLIYGVVF